MHRCHMVYAHKRNDVTCPCALGSRRVEESRKACRARARARFLRTHGHLSHLLSRTQLWLSVWRRVLGASLEAAKVFSAWRIWRKKTCSILPINFQYITLYTFSEFTVNQLLLSSTICKKSLFKVFVCSISYGL